MGCSLIYVQSVVSSFRLCSRDVAVRSLLSPYNWDLLVDLVNDVQAHLVQSKATRAAYLKLLANFYDSSAEARALRPKPTDDDVLHYFRDNFPHIHIRRLVHPAGSSCGFEEPCDWRAQGEDLNETFIEADPIIAMLHRALGDRDPQQTLIYHMSLDARTFIAAVMLLNGLRYPLIKYFFGPVLPDPYGPYIDSMASHEGWPDWDIEHALFGLHFIGECPAGACNVTWDMTTLLAEKCDKSYVLDDPQELRHFLDSFKTNTLHKTNIVNATKISAHPSAGAHRERIESAFYCGSVIRSAIHADTVRALEGVETISVPIGGHCRG